MRLSRYFMPILKETPKEAEIVSHRLMLRAGMLRQEAAGIYAFLPLGLRVLTKICAIVREEQDRSGAILLLAHDRAHLAQHAQPQRQKGVDAGGFLPDHAGTQHQPMRDDLGLFGSLAQDRQEETGQAHGESVRFGGAARE